MAAQDARLHSQTLLCPDNVFCVTRGSSGQCWPGQLQTIFTLSFFSPQTLGRVNKGSLVQTYLHNIYKISTLQYYLKCRPLASSMKLSTLYLHKIYSIYTQFFSAAVWPRYFSTQYIYAIFTLTLSTQHLHNIQRMYKLFCSPQSLGLVYEGSLVGVCEQLPVSAQPLGDLGVVHLGRQRLHWHCLGCYTCQIEANLAMATKVGQWRFCI